MISSWPTAVDARIVAEEGNQDDILRAILTACINRQNGAFRSAVFDGMGGGKSYLIELKVTQV